MNFKNPLPEKKSFNFYFSWGDLLRKIDAESVKELILALVDYAETGSPPDFSENLVCDLVFTQMSKQVEADTKKYIITSLRNSLNATMRWNKDNDLGYKGMEEFHCSKEEREEKFKAIAKQMMMGTYATASDRIQSNADIDVDVDVDVETEEGVVVGEEADPESVPHSGQHDNSQQHTMSPSEKTSTEAMPQFQFTDCIPPVRSEIEEWFEQRVLYNTNDAKSKAVAKTDRFYKMHEKYDWHYVREGGLLNKLVEFIRDDKFDKQMYTDFLNWTPDFNKPKKTENTRQERSFTEYDLFSCTSYDGLMRLAESKGHSVCTDFYDLIKEYHELQGQPCDKDIALQFLKQELKYDGQTISHIRNTLLDEIDRLKNITGNEADELPENQSTTDYEYVTDDEEYELPFS